jgi:predicted Rdx family selenoprotein
MKGNIRNTITNCKQCNELYSRTWTDQELCPQCKPLSCDRMRLELAMYMSKLVWCRYPR